MFARIWLDVVAPVLGIPWPPPPDLYMLREEQPRWKRILMAIHTAFSPLLRDAMSTTVNPEDKRRRQHVTVLTEDLASPWRDAQNTIAAISNVAIDILASSDEFSVQ